MKLTTTFNLLRKAGACESGYKKLAQSLGGVPKYGADTPINLLQILESNGVEDTLWCLRATVEPEGKRVAQGLAIEFAAEVLPIFEAKYPDDARPRAALQGARDYLAGKITLEELRGLRSAVIGVVVVHYAADAAAAAAAAAAADAYAAAAADAAADAYAAADADAARQQCRDRQAAITRAALADKEEA